MTDQAASEPQTPLLDFTAIWRTLWSRKLLILGVSAAFVGLALVYIVTTRPTFTATAVVLVDPRGARTTETDNVLPGIGSDSAAIASQVAVISSRELLSSVFESQGLMADPEFTEPGLLDGILGNRPSYAAAFDGFVGRVGVEREGLTYVLDVFFTSTDPDKAARLANAVVDAYISGQVAQKSAANAEVSDLLKGRIAELQQDVLDAERAVQDFKVANGIFDSSTGGTMVQAQLDQLNAQLTAAQESARQAEVKYQQASGVAETPQGLISLTEVLSSASAERLRDDYNARATAIASAEVSLGPRHPTLVKMRAELQQVEELMVREIRRVVEELRATRDAAQTVVERVQGDIAALQTNANESNRSEVELRQLERNADASRQVLEQFLRRSEETSQFQDLQFSDARVITKATSPLRATWPKSSLLLAVAGGLGLAAGAGLALLMGSRSGTPAALPRNWLMVPVPRLRRPPPRKPTGPGRKQVAPKVEAPKPVVPRPVEPARPVAPTAQRSWRWGGLFSRKPADEPKRPKAEPVPVTIVAKDAPRPAAQTAPIAKLTEAPAVASVVRVRPPVVAAVPVQAVALAPAIAPVIAVVRKPAPPVPAPIVAAAAVPEQSVARPGLLARLFGNKPKAEPVAEAKPTRRVVRRVIRRPVTRPAAAKPVQAPAAQPSRRQRVPSARPVSNSAKPMARGE